jgi:neutral ceramidase
MPVLILIVALLVNLLVSKPLSAQWKAGVARADITPTKPVPLAGYGGATRMSNKVEHPIWLKALALQDSTQNTYVIVTADLVGLSPKMVNRIVDSAKKRHQLPRQRLILNCSHNHSCPVTEDVLWLYYDLSAEETAARDQYTQFVYEQYDRCIADAIANLQPAELSFEQGLAGFAVNRRRSRGAESRALPGPVDHDVPVLTIKSDGQVKAILFGYSCHTTALGGLSINGDYAGFAQIALEKSYPQSIAMFVQNCGGDINPLPRIRGKDQPATALAAMYGEILAEAVRQVVDGPCRQLLGPMKAVMDEIELELQPGPELDKLKIELATASGMRKRELQLWIDQTQKLGATPSAVNYPIQIWSFGGDLTWIALTGETVVDYSLKFKEQYGWNSTWVTGYNDDLLSYVPSLRVLNEGGYEGTTGMHEYGHRAPYTENVEQRIVDSVAKLMKNLREN